MTDTNGQSNGIVGFRDDAHTINVDPSPDVKPGHKTTEFYIHLAVVILGALATLAGVVESYSKGAIGGQDALLALGGVTAATLNALGYTASRTIVKASAIFLLAIALSLMVVGCSSVSPAAKKELEDNSAACQGNLHDWDGLTEPEKKRAYSAAGRGFADLDFSIFGVPLPPEWAPVTSTSGSAK